MHGATQKVQNIELNRFSEDINDSSIRSINLLNAIEFTITSLTRLTGHLKADSLFAFEILKFINEFDAVIDEDDVITTKLEQAQESVLNLYNALRSKREFANEDHRLNADDGIEDAFTEAISASADLQNNINELRWHILEHDADYSQVSKTYRSMDDLLKDLSS